MVLSSGRTVNKTCSCWTEKTH